jgi:Tfp pilus assembly protein PilX
MRNERGVVLVIAVLIMITATFLGIAAVMTSNIEVRMSGNQRSMEGALYAADGGIDKGLNWLVGSGATKPDESDLPTMKGVGCNEVQALLLPNPFRRLRKTPHRG